MAPQHDDDPVWDRLYAEVEAMAAQEPILASYLHATVLNHKTLHDALSFLLAQKLSCNSLPSMLIREFIDEAMADDPAIGDAVRADLVAIEEREPAADGYAQPFLNYKGFHALESHRINHWLWQRGRKALARHMQSRISEIFTVDVHPAARVGRGILLDHATGIIIGETAVIDDDVSILHEVTLGGTGKTTGDRHPKIRRGVLIGAGAKILGNVEIGAGAKVAAGSVVLADVAPHCTVAGVPAVVVGRPDHDAPALEMNQRLSDRE